MQHHDFDTQSSILFDADYDALHSKEAQGGD